MLQQKYRIYSFVSLLSARIVSGFVIQNVI
jgi:hypothetical protein